MTYLAAYGAVLIAFLLGDAVWLSLMVPRFYRPAMGDLMAADVNLAPAVVFYLLYPVGTVIFAVSPALKSGNVLNAAILGSLFGLFTYGTYDLTNHATLRNWPAALTVVDMAWGGFLGGASAVWAAWIVGKFMPPA